MVTMKAIKAFKNAIELNSKVQDVRVLPLLIWLSTQAKDPYGWWLNDANGTKSKYHYHGHH
jgi:hypothetical protein